MPTMDEKRTWLRDQGHAVPDRGRLRKELEDEWQAAHPDIYDNGQVIDPDLPADGGITDDDFAEAEATVIPETRPVRPRRTRSAGKKPGGILGNLLGGKTGSGKPRAGKKVPRVSLDKFLGRVYTRGGQLVSAFAPATGRCLQAQSAMAGIILEDIAKDTVIDRALQPMARVEDKLDKGFALVAPPVLVFALETTDPENMMRRAMLTGLLRESLLISMDVTSAYAERIEENTRRTKENEAAVDKLLRFIFDVPTAEAEPEMAGAAA